MRLAPAVLSFVLLAAAAFAQTDGASPAEPAPAAAPPAAPATLSQLAVFKSSGTATLNGTALRTFGSLSCGGSLEVDGQSAATIMPDRQNYLLLAGIAGGEAAKLGASQIATPNVNLTLESGVLLFALSPSVGMPQGILVAAGDATVALNACRGLIKVEKGALTVIVGDGSGEVRTPGAPPVALVSGQAVTRAAGAAPAPVHWVFWPDAVDKVGLAPAAAELGSRRVGLPFMPGRNFVLIVGVLFVVFLVQSVYPKSGDVACLLAVAFVFLEAMFGLTRFWVDLKIASVPLGAFAGSLLMLGWGLSEQSHKNVRRTPGGAVGVQLGRYAALLVVGLLMSHGVLAFSGAGPQSVLALGRTNFSLFMDPMVSRLPPSTDSFAYECLAALVAALLGMALRRK
jgi:hypothetical protein